MTVDGVLARLSHRGVPASASAEAIVERQDVWEHPITRVFEAVTIKDYWGAGWGQHFGADPRRIEFASGDVYWLEGMTHARIFYGTDGSAFVHSWGAGQSQEYPEICRYP